MNFKGNFWPVRAWVVAGFAALFAPMGSVGFISPALSADFGTAPYSADEDYEQGYDDTLPRHQPRYAERDDAQRFDEVYGNDYAEHNGDVSPYDDQRYLPPKRGSLKDDYDDRAFGERRWGHRSFARRDRACVPQRRIRRMLRRAGWRGFRHGRVRGNIGYVTARKRGTGEIYELAVDRCTGDLISAACIEGPDRRWRRRGIGFRDYREDVVIRW